jgi:calcineurin-like phosphoesterase family protein
MLGFYKIKKKQDQKVFFWSDLHLCHDKDFILNPRNFSDATHAKSEISERWRAKISNKDIVFLLGDTVVGAGDKGGEELTQFLHSVSFQEVYLMPGNHVSGYSQILNSAIEQGYSFNKDLILKFNFSEQKIINLIPNYFEISLDGELIVQSHYALLSWNKMGSGSYHLHGHSHSNLNKTQWVKDNYLTGKVFDLSVENCPSPVEFSEIQKYMSNQKIINPDHH